MLPPSIIRSSSVSCTVYDKAVHLDPVLCHPTQERTSQRCASSQNTWNRKYSCTTDSWVFQDSSQTDALYIPAWLETSELLHPQLLLQLLPRLVPQQGVLPAVPTVPLCQCLPHSNPNFGTQNDHSHACFIMLDDFFQRESLTMVGCSVVQTGVLAYQVSIQRHPYTWL